MKKFRFTMQTVLETREREEEQARASLMEVERILAECEDTLNALITRQIEHQKEMARIGRTIQRTDEMNELFHFSQMIVSQIDQQNRLLAEAERRVEEKRMALQRIIQERKMLETLRDKQRQEWQAGVYRAEQETLDEIGAAAHHRTAEQGSAMTNGLVILAALIFAGLVFFSVMQINEWLTNRWNPPVAVPGTGDHGSDSVHSATDTHGHVASATGEIGSATGTGSGHVGSASPSINWSDIPTIRTVQEEVYRKHQDLLLEEEEIARKRAGLEEYAKEIDASRKAVEERIAYFEKLKAEVERREKLNLDAKIQALAQIYNGMEADQVAGFILSETDNARAVTILTKMQAFAAQEVISSMGRDEKNKAHAKEILDAWVALRS